MTTTDLAKRAEPYIIRQDALGNTREVMFSEFKLACCPPNTSDATALAFMGACAALGAIPEVKDLELAEMKGRPVIIIREQFYIKNLKRHYPHSVERYGLIGGDGKPKAMNAPIHADDLMWHEIYLAPGSNILLGRAECVRREWDKGGDAWEKMRNHMLLLRARTVNAKRVAPVEIPADIHPFPAFPEVTTLEMLDAGDLGTEEAVGTAPTGLLDEGENTPDAAPEPAKAVPPADTPTPAPVAAPAGAETPQNGDPEEPWAEETDKPESDASPPTPPPVRTGPDAAVEENKRLGEQATKYVAGLSASEVKVKVFDYARTRFPKDKTMGMAFVSAVLGKTWATFDGMTTEDLRKVLLAFEVSQE